MSVEPKGSNGNCIRAYRLKLKNNSGTPVLKCQVKMIGLMNKNKQESDAVGMRFKLSRERAVDLMSYAHKEEFDIKPNDNEEVDLATMDEVNKKTHILMLYTMQGKGSQGIRNTIPVELCPHFLKVRISASNIVEPIDSSYKMIVNARGIFKIKPMKAENDGAQKISQP